MNSGQQNYLRTRMSSAGFGDQPKEGDLIEASCGPFMHWAVYVGDGYVVHMTNLESPGSVRRRRARAVVRKDLLPEQDEGYRYRINNKYDEKMLPLRAEEIVRRAEEMVGKEILYNLTNYNYERFVTELRYGVPMCDQVQDKGPGMLERVDMAMDAIYSFVFNGSRISSSD